MFASMALSGLGTMGNMWFQSNMQDKQNQFQLDYQSNQNLFQMQYLQQMLSGQYNNQLGLQENYQNWMNDFTTMKFNQSLEYANHQAQLNGMNTPASLMASRGSKSITSSDPENNRNRPLIGTGPLYSNFVQGETLNPNNLAHGEVEEDSRSISQQAPSDTQSLLGNDSSSNSSVPYQDASSIPETSSSISTSDESSKVESDSAASEVDSHLNKPNWLTHDFTYKNGKPVLKGQDVNATISTSMA